MNRVGVDEFAYVCLIRTTHDLLCMSELVPLQIQRELIHVDIIHIFWRKLQIEEYEIIEKIRTQMNIKEECEDLKKYFNTLDIVVHTAMKQKVCELHILIQLLCVCHM